MGGVNNVKKGSKDKGQTGTRVRAKKSQTQNLYNDL